MRAAAVARKVYMGEAGIGVKTLRAKFGANKRNGTVSSHHHIADAQIIRYCVKQLSKMGLVDLVTVLGEDEKGNKVQLYTKGRKASKKGRAEMDKIATQIYKKQNPRKA